MAEAIAAIGVVASVSQLAEYGFKLSVQLFTFSQAVSTADQSIKTISNDVSLTSTVLKELSQIIGSDESHMVSETAFQATKQAVTECLSVFEQLSNALDKSLSNMGMLEGEDGKKKAKRGTIALEKLKWPFKQSKMELLRSNLDRLKASLTLMLQVLSYARDVSNRKAAESSLVYQQHLIERLARSERATRRKYLALETALENEYSQIGLMAMNTSALVPPAREIDPSRPPSVEESPNHPPVKPRTLIGEIRLCFRVLNDLLGYKEDIMKQRKMESSSLSNFLKAWYSFQEPELTRLDNVYGVATDDVRMEAAKNVEARLKDLARDDSSKLRFVEHTSWTETTSVKVADAQTFTNTEPAYISFANPELANIELDKATMHARRRTVNLWRVLFLGPPMAVAKLGSASYNGIRRGAKSVYEAGSSLLASPNKPTSEVPPEALGRPTPIAIAAEPGNIATEPPEIAAESLIDYSHEEEDVTDKNVVEDLLSAWTNLSSYHNE